MNLADIRRKAQAALAQARSGEAQQAQPQAADAVRLAPAPSRAEPAPRQAAYAPPLAQDARELPQAPPVPERAAAPDPAPPWEESREPDVSPPVLGDPTNEPPFPSSSQGGPTGQAPYPPDRAALSAPVPRREELNDSPPQPPADRWALDDPTTQPPFPLYPEAGPFDPAAVILQGRESAGDGEQEERETEQAEETLELLCFRVASEDYAISIMDIKEIIKPREVTEVPRVPAFVRGILSLRGIIIPVFDMRLRLGLPAGERSERERVVVVKRRGGFCGVLVDQVVQVVRIPRAGVEAPPVVLEGIDREFVKGIGRVAGGMLILLDIEKVLDVSLV